MADARAQTRTPVDLAPVTWWFMVRTMVGARIRAQAGFRSSFAADLASLPRRIAEEQIASPALLIVGTVVSLHDRLAWFEPLPAQAREAGNGVL